MEMCGLHRLEQSLPKKQFLLLKIDRLVDSMIRFEFLISLNVSFRYHKIPMHPEDEGKTSFFNEKKTFYYHVMHFVLKHTGAKYQWMVNKVFKHQIGKNMKAYIDDMLVKSMTFE